MNPPNLFQKLAIAGVAGTIGVAGVQFSALSGTFIDQGYSIFAAPDPGVPGVPNVQPDPGVPASRQCAGCDSTVSFALYEPDPGENWFETLFPGKQFGGSIDTDTPYVFLYQVVNTDPLPSLENPLSSFEVAIEQKQGDVGTPWTGPSPYSSAGWVVDTVFGTGGPFPGAPITHTASTDINDNFGPVPDPPGGVRQTPQECVDPGDNGCPGNWTPDVLDSDFEDFAMYTPTFEPASVQYIPAPSIIDDEVARQGGPSGTSGYLWLWQTPGGEIQPTDPTGPDGRGTSPILFLTADTELEFNEKLVNEGLVDPVCATNPVQNNIDCGWNFPNYPWARTQSLNPPGEGTSGDVVGLKVKIMPKVPEPSTILGLLAVGGLGLGMKRKKS